MGSALLDTTPGSAAESAAGNAAAAARTSAGDALRQQAAERLAAHRSKRAGLSSRGEAQPQTAATGNARAAHIAAAVAERYAKSQSYRAFLAAEAERAVEQAHAAAEVAAMNARAMEAAQQSLLDALESAAERERTQAGLRAETAGISAEATGSAQAASGELADEELSLWPEAQVAAKAARPVAARRSGGEQREPVRAAEPNAALSAAYAGRLEQEVARPSVAREALRHNRMSELEAADALALDEEIAFRHAPVFEEFVTRTEPLPANLIQFPRQLVASRKARPRLAEGPLRDEAPEAGESQLRIFEVETAQISIEPVVEDAQTAAQWTSIFLDTPRALPAAIAEPVDSLPGAASVARRVTSAAINTGVLGLAVAAFAATAMAASGNVDALRSLSAASVMRMALSNRAELLAMLAAGAGVWLFLCFVYQALFFTFSTATPGMRCVRIGLCTFKDENPSRRSMRRRILAVLLSAIPFGLGFVWATLDEDKLSWHDRVSGMYLRVY